MHRRNSPLNPMSADHNCDGMGRCSVVVLLSLVAAVLCSGQSAPEYRPLDPNNPIIFQGDAIVYQGRHITLGPKAFFVDGQLTAEQAGRYPYVFNSVNEAARHLTDGTEAAPMVLHLAPYVYWIDDPDDPAVRMPQRGRTYFLSARSSSFQDFLWILACRSRYASARSAMVSPCRIRCRSSSGSVPCPQSTSVWRAASRA